MDFELNSVEVRVLGSLLEKSMTTPDYYPLTLNSLTTACNQKSNRTPVMALDDTAVVRALDSLKEKRLAVQGDSSRVPKYAEVFVTGQNLINREAAVIYVLMLRGPQTLGELRTRTERAYKFDSVEAVEEVVADLIESAYVMKMDRQPGRKEPRYAQLLAGEPEIEVVEIRAEPATLEVRAENERMDELLLEVEQLRADLTSLQAEFARFKKEFE